MKFFCYKKANKRTPGDDVGKFTQCAGTYPITFNEVSYTPAIWEPGNTVTKHIVGESTVPIEDGVIATWNIYLKDKFLFSFSADYCMLAAALDEPCPVQPGHFDKTHEWKVEESPFQPKDMTVDYFVNSTVVSKDQTVLACLEGTVSIKYP
ncbi:2723_t:CDS:2 [Entrophospora sp. SA101]|nr:2723_t:CDS:2 [Entrophospora sp. SA101]